MMLDGKTKGMPGGVAPWLPWHVTQVGALRSPFSKTM